MSEVNIKIGNVTVKKMDYHRNGVSGAAFWVFLFEDTEYPECTFVASLFGSREDLNPICSVFAVDELAKGNISFGPMGNSWRGDRYSAKLWRAVEEYVREATEWWYGKR